MKRSIILATVAVALCTVASQNAAAQSDFGFKKLGVAVGYVSPEDMDGTFSIGGFADLGTVAPRFGIEARLDYWSVSETQEVPFPGAPSAEASVRDITLGARGKYYFPVSSTSVRPFAGAGLGMHFVKAEVSIPPVGPLPGMSVEDSSTELGLDLGGGMATSLGAKTDLLAELWYTASDLGQLSLRAGLAFKL
ncbi:MAG: outer membrane beta-barrel protein [Candidatus Eiseniibacteriota bacterium]